MNRARVFRFLRIGWSVGCGIVCLLLIVLWVRSDWSSDSQQLITSKNRYEVSSSDGQLIVVRRTRFFKSLEALLAYPDDLKPALTKNTTLGFGRYLDDNFSGVSFAYWLLVPTTAMVAAIPWPRWRFSLRTLLIAMTVVAVVIGVIVVLSR
jgi:hypothetical protein